MKKKTFLATLNGQKLQNAIFLLQVLPTRLEKIMKVNNFKEEVGQRVFFFKGILFSGFDAMAVKVCSRFENWSKSIFFKNVLKLNVITPSE